LGGGIDIRLACRPQDVEGRPVEGRSALGARQARSARVCVCVCTYVRQGTDAHRLSRQAFTALQAFIALVGSRFGAVCMRRCIDVQSARVIIYVHGVCVWVASASTTRTVLAPSTPAARPGRPPNS
jgi:hypothetical protein